MGKLYASAAHPGMVTTTHLKCGIFNDLLPRLVDPRLPCKDQPRHDQRLRTGSALG